MSKNLTALSSRKGLENNLFERIGELSESTGAPDREALRVLAEEFLMGPANVYGASTFYDFTSSSNAGKKVYVCNGTACKMAGAQDALKKRLLEHFEAGEIGEMSCLGRCHENHAFQWEGRNYSGQPTLGSAWPPMEAANDAYHVAAHGSAVLTREFPSLEACRLQIDRLLAAWPEEILKEIHHSRLRGRGGAGFPVGIKMESCRRAPGHQKYVVCNADEGDPGSYSDRYLLEHRPHAVLLGMLIAGYVVGADKGVIYTRIEYPEAIEAITKAIHELADAGLSGKNILNRGFDFEFKLIKGRGAYICGEETALLASIEGQRPEVRVRPPFPTEEGLFGKPTLVNNVETLANLCTIIAEGGQTFASIGTGKSTGTKLVSVDGSFQRPGVYEVDMGTPLSVLIQELAGGFRRPVKALHIGGPLGGIVPVAAIPDLTIDFESFAQHGFLLGHASMVGIPEDFPMIAYLEHLFAFTAHESCGKCFPCRIGSVRGQELLARAQNGSAIDPVLFNDLLETLEKGSLCGLGGGIPLPVRNAMTYFEKELSPYFQSAVHA